MVNGNGTETGQTIVITIGGRNGQPKQVNIIFLKSESFTSLQIKNCSFTCTVL